MAVDKITLEILRNFFQAISDAMAYVVLRTAHTTFVKETGDFATGLVTPEGEIFVRARDLGTTQSLGINFRASFAAIKAYEPGDIVLTNDPYSTRGMATHLPDLHVYKPIFYQGKIVCWAWSFIHCSDIGGMVPASVAPICSEIYQEGFRIPPQKLYRAGVLNEDLLQLVQANCRIPEQNWGDLKAMVAGLNTAETRLLEMIVKFGPESVQAGMNGLLDYAEERARAIFATIPNGEYRFVDYLEDDVVSDIPIRYEVRLVVQDGRVHLDLTGSDSQVNAAFNLPTGGLPHPLAATALFCYLCTRDPHLPLNGGILRAVDMTLPRGSVVNPEFPAACGIRWGSVSRIHDATLGAFHQAVPDQVPAPGAGQVAMIVTGFPDFGTGKRKVAVVEPMFGGGGARNGQDGVDACDPLVGFLRNTPVESIENEVPIEIRQFELMPDSAAPGRWNSGHGVRLDFQILSPGCVITARGMERFKLTPWGVHGGRHGPTGQALLNPGTPQEQSTGKINALPVQTGDVFSLRTPSGGGYGNPLDRPTDLVLAQHRSGLLSVAAAQERYGVVIQDGAVDEASTAGLRTRQRAERPALGRYDFGPRRTQYDADIGETVGRGVALRLLTLPAAVRPLVRREIHRRLNALVEAGRRPLSTADLDEVWDSTLAMMMPGRRAPVVAAG